MREQSRRSIRREARNPHNLLDEVAIAKFHIVVLCNSGAHNVCKGSVQAAVPSETRAEGKCEDQRFDGKAERS